MMRLDEDEEEMRGGKQVTVDRRQETTSMSTREELSPEISKAGLIHFFQSSC